MRSLELSLKRSTLGELLLLDWELGNRSSRDTKNDLGSVRSLLTPTPHVCLKQPSSILRLISYSFVHWLWKCQHHLYVSKVASICICQAGPPLFCWPCKGKAPCPQYPGRDKFHVLTVKSSFRNLFDHFLFMCPAQLTKVFLFFLPGITFSPYTFESFKYLTY